jgi:hypothetical protein
LLEKKLIAILKIKDVVVVVVAVQTKANVVDVIN